MTKEDKELLIKTLCAMLPYNVILHIRYYDLQGNGGLGERDVELTYGNIGYCVSRSHWIDFKPYLRPMSSMTEEERLLFYQNTLQYNEETGYSEYTYKSIDWLNKYHFDYRGLIERGLAIEVTDDNNPYKN